MASFNLTWRKCLCERNGLAFLRKTHIITGYQNDDAGWKELHCSISVFENYPNPTPDTRVTLVFFRFRDLKAERT